MSIARRGAAEAGAVFVIVDRRDGSCDLYGPAPQAVFGEERPAERLFFPMLRERPEQEARSRMESELRFDPDLWLVDIEDREGRAFVEVVSGAG